VTTATEYLWPTMTAPPADAPDGVLEKVQVMMTAQTIALGHNKSCHHLSLIAFSSPLFAASCAFSQQPVFSTSASAIFLLFPVWPAGIGQLHQLCDAVQASS
jgi:hypothetical protein